MFSISDPADKKKYWLAGIVFVVLLSFVLSDSFRTAISRRRAIHHAEKELQQLTLDVDQMQDKVVTLEKNPQAYEQLVRQELGYMRPGEKEIRFLEKKRE